jgi:hypothetical protein
MTTEAMAVLDRLEAATAAAIALARQLAAVHSADDEWLRMPAKNSGRCPISRWSRSKLYKLAEAGQVRTKSVAGARFYSAADVRKLLTE